ncbi:hypothetical protein GCM10027423_52540 [Spirosoma arcticum]
MAMPLKAQPPTVAQSDSLWLLLRANKADTNRVKVLLQLGTNLFLKPGESLVDLDKALSFTQQAEVLSEKLSYTRGQGNSYLLFSQIYREKGSRKIGEKYIDKAVEFLRLHQTFEELGAAYLEHKHYYSAFASKEELQKRIQLVEQALAAFQRSGNRLKQANTLEELADLHTIANNLPQSLLELKQALAIYQAIGYRPLQAVYDLLGAVSSQLGDYKEGIRYGLLAVETAEQLGDLTTMVCTIYNRVGLTYFFLKKHEQAIIYFRKGLTHAIRLNDHQAIHILTHNLSNGLQRLNRSEEALSLIDNIVKKYPPTELNDQVLLTANFVRVYIRLKRYNQAEQYFNQLLQIKKANETGDFDYIAFYNTATEYFFSTHQYNQARKYLKDHQALVTKVHLVKEAATVQRMWFKLDSAQGNYISAINHYQKYKTFEDSLLGEAKSRQVTNLEIQYETGKKEQDIKIKQERIFLLTEKNNVQQTQRNALIGGSGLLLTILLLGFNRYQLKQRSNQLLEVQQRQLKAQHEELQTQQEALQAQQKEIGHRNDELQRLLTEKERLLKEIHHRVKNNLQIVMSLLNSQAASLQDQAALSAIQQSQHRVQAMALIHQKLYQTEGIARIPMAEYIAELVAYLHESFNLPQPIRFVVQVAPIELDVTQAVPLGLIINEAITNALKYAFLGGRPGTVQVGLRSVAQTGCELLIADDGVGLPADFDPTRSRSLGMTLIRGFSEQLGGELEVISPPGLSLRLLFQDETYLVNA